MIVLEVVFANARDYYAFDGGALLDSYGSAYYHRDGRVFVSYRVIESVLAGVIRDAASIPLTAEVSVE